MGAMFEELPVSTPHNDARNPRRAAQRSNVGYNPLLAIHEPVSVFLALSCFLPNEDRKWILSVT